MTEYSATHLHEELQRLDEYDNGLEEALADFDHQLRRLGETLERSGHRDRTASTQIRQLQENRRLTLADLERNQRLRAELQGRLDAG